MRAAGQRYQKTLQGRLRHARRQSRWRVRQSQKVTHHGFPTPGSDANVGSHKEVDDNAQAMAMDLPDRAATGGNAAPARPCPQRPSEKPGSMRRCAWCGAAAMRLARLQRWQR